MAEDYYQVLGVPKNASKDQIKKAYKKLAIKHHPDKNKGDKASEEKFKKINEAYAVLSNDEKRRQYDQFGAEGFSNRFSQEDIFSGFDFGNIFSEFGFDGGSGQNIFSSFFGGSPGKKSNFSFDFGGQQSDQRSGQRRRANSQPAGENIETELELSFLEAVEGGKKTISFNTGQGIDKLVLAIPAGIEQGKKLKLKNKGNPHPMTGIRGDLYCRIKVRPHEKYERDGYDIILKQTVKITDLLLGGSINTETLNGKQIELKIPPLSKNNSFLRIKGKGIVNPKGENGSLLIKLVAKIPEKITEEQEELILKLRDLNL